MPNLKSGKKALKQSQAKRAVNLKSKKELRQSIKDFKKTLEAEGKDKAAGLLPGVYKRLDKAVKSKIIKANKAARFKSRLSKNLAK